MHLLRSLISDEAGFAFTPEFIVISVMTVAVVIVGGAVMRDSLVQELADWAIAVGAVNQSYEFRATNALDSTGGTQATGAGSGFEDQSDDGDGTGIEFFLVCGLDDPSPTNILE